MHAAKVDRLSPPAQRRVAVIGGGLSGLATAVQLHLADPGLQLTLLEASAQLGGVIDTRRRDEYLIDLGADMFATKPAAALHLLERLGVADRLMRPSRRAAGARIVHRGKLVDVPDGFVLMRATRAWPILTTPLLSIAGKLRLLREPWVAPLLAGDPETDISVGEFVRHRLGNEVLRNIVEPLVAGIYTADIDKLSMRATMAPLAKMEADHGSLGKATWARRRSGEDSLERSSSGARYEQFRAFPGGMKELIECLAAALPDGTIRTDTPVDGLSRLDRGWELTTAGGPEQFDEAIIATPAAVSAKLLEPHSPAAATALASIEAASTAIVVLALRRDQVAGDINTFGFVVPPKENRQILAASFASNKFDGRAPADCILVRVFIGGSLQADLLRKSDPELVQLACKELSELIRFAGDPLLAEVVRWNHAMPQYHVGHLQKVERIEAEIDRLPGLWLISNALRGVGIAPLIDAAEKLAAKIIASSQP